MTNLTLVNSEDSIDKFYNGRFYIVQPKKNAHKAGLDALLLASCVEEHFTGTIADFGSGAGAAGLAVLARCSAAKIALVENCEIMLNYARKTLALTENQLLSERAKLLALDISKIGSAQNLANSFDFIIMNPPYNAPTSQQSQHILRARAHVKTPDLFEIWLKKAAHCLKAKAKLALIAKPYALHEILQAFGRRFGSIKIYPIYPHKQADLLRLIFIVQKNSRGALEIKPPIFIREQAENGELILTEKFTKISNGLCSIYDEI